MKIKIGRKHPEYYKGILVKADPGLHKQITERIKKHCPQKSRLLDLGAGEGALTQRLVDLGYEVTAVDICAGGFRCKSASLIQVDLNDALEVKKFADTYYGYFDAVLGVEVIEHLENPWEYVRFLKKMTKPGGLVLITTPNIASWLSRLHFLLTGRFYQFSENDLGYGHIAPISPFELRHIMHKEGLTNISIEPGGTLPDIWIQPSTYLFFLNILAIPFRPFMRDLHQGWCVIATGING